MKLLWQVAVAREGGGKTLPGRENSKHDIFGHFWRDIIPCGNWGENLCIKIARCDS